MKGRNDTTPAKADTGHFENPADAEAAKQVAAGLAAGEDVFGDNDNDDGTPMTGAPAPAPAAEATPPAAAPAAEDLDAGENLEAQDNASTTQTQEATPPAPAPAPTPAPAPPVLQFKTKTAAELAAAQKALLDKKAEAFDKYSVGTMTAAEYSAVDSEVMLGLMGIASEAALAQANTQTALNASEQALADVKALAKSQGLVDYEADESAGVQFDNVVDMLAKDPKMAALSDADFFSKAHNLVLTMRGHTPPATGNAPAPSPTPSPAKPRQDMTGPITLRSMPAAATPNTGGGVAEQLGRLNGLDFEEAVGSMSRQQRDAWIDS